MTEAAVREAEATAAVREPGTGEALPGWARPDPQDLADTWTARHLEWRRVQDWMSAAEAGVYDPEQDRVGSAWARERTERRAAALADHAAWMDQRRNTRDELRVEVWLDASTGRRLRAVAEGTGLAAEQALAQLAQHVVCGPDGTLSVPPFAPVNS